MKNQIVPLVGALMMIAVAAAEAVSFTLSPTPPSQNVILSNTAVAVTSLSARYTGDESTDHRDVGQTFVLSESATLSQISIFLPGAAATTVARPFTLTIEQFATSSVTSSRTLISEQSGNLSNISTGAQWITFTLDTAVDLQANSIYGFRFGFDTLTTTSSIAISFAAGTSYTGGTGYQIVYPDGEATLSASSNDVRFLLVAIPEPSVLGFIIMGGLLLPFLPSLSKLKS